jgi:hypothetical protein
VVVKGYRDDRVVHPKHWLSIFIFRRQETLRVGHSTITITNCIGILRLRVFKNRVLRTLRPKGDEVIAEWRRLHNEEFYDLYSSPTVNRVIKVRKWVGFVAGMGDNRDEYRISMGIPEGMRPPRRPQRRWEDSIKISSGSGKGTSTWIDLAQDRSR